MARFNGGWVKIHRKAVEEDIGQRGNFTLGLFVRLVRMANWREGSNAVGGQRVVLQPGQLVSGLRELSPNHEEDPYLHRVRNALNYLEKRGTITQAASNQGRIITLCNWEDYQCPDDDASGESASEAQADRKQSASEAQHIEEEKKRRKKEEGKSADALPRLAVIWNGLRGGLPEVKGCSGTRKKHAEARWRENSDANYWADIIDRITRSPFCTGQNDRGWRADFDFLIQPGTQHKVLEGKYDARGAAPVTLLSHLSAKEKADLDEQDRELERARRILRGEEDWAQ